MNRSQENSGIDKRIWWLMLGRVGLATLLLGVAISLQFRQLALFPVESTAALYRTALLFYLVSIAYVFLLRVIDRERAHIYIQSLCDIGLVSVLVYLTGGCRSVYSAFYQMIVIYSVIFLGRRGGMTAASACSIVYGLLVDLEYYGWIEPPTAFLLQDLPLTPGEALTRSFVHILSFFVIALLASFVVGQERRARLLLAEKQTAFDQLDVLHRSIIESVDAGIFTIDLLGRIKSFNRAAEEITGYVFAELLNRPLREVFPAIAAAVEKANEQPPSPEGRQKGTDLAFARKDGERLVLGWVLSPLRGAEGKRIGSIVIFHDLTAVKKMEAEYEKNRRLAFVGEMAAVLAHEIRNPLASISGSIQVLRKDLQLNAADERLMSIILRGKDQIETFMKDFLLLARPSPGTKETIELRGLVNDVVEAIRYVSDWHEGIRVELTGDDARISANRAEMRQLIWNLLMNAVQSISEEGAVSVCLARTSDPDGVTLRVSDTGAGMRKDVLQRVFEPFYTTRERGTGLGLAIVRRIVENHGGRVRLESEPGRGTSVAVWLSSRPEKKPVTADAASEVGG